MVKTKKKSKGKKLNKKDIKSDSPQENDKEKLEAATKIISEQLLKKAEELNKFNSVVESFNRVPPCEDVIYTWVYNYIDKNGIAQGLEFKFKSIPMKEYNRIEELIPTPEPEKLPMVNKATGQPVLNEDGSCRMEAVEDENYNKQKEKSSNHKTIALIEVSLGYQVPGKNYDEKYEWFLDHPLTMWRSMYNIIWSRLLGGGLVNFT